MVQIPKFDTIEMELLAKGMAITLVVPPEIGNDISDTMRRASAIIGEVREALYEIREIGISEEGRFSKTAMLADNMLMILKENSN